MQTIVLQPKRSRLLNVCCGIALLCTLTVLIPETALITALVMPLFSCVLIGQRVSWVGWIGICVPSLISILSGIEPIYSLSLLLIGLFPMIITELPLKRRLGSSGILMYSLSIAAALCFVSLAVLCGSGKPFPVYLSELIVRKIRQYPQPGILLYKLSQWNLLRIPREWLRKPVLMLTASEDSAGMKEGLLSFGTTLKRMLPSVVSYGCVQVSILIGLFTALRTEKINGTVLIVTTKKNNERFSQVVMPPGFRMLFIPKGLRIPMVLCTLAGLVLLVSARGIHPFCESLAMMCLAIPVTLLSLQFSATILFLVSVNRPDSMTAASVIVALLCMLFPAFMCTGGALDLLLNIRKRGISA